MRSLESVFSFLLFRVLAIILDDYHLRPYDSRLTKTVFLLIRGTEMADRSCVLQGSQMITKM